MINHDEIKGIQSMDSERIRKDRLKMFEKAQKEAKKEIFSDSFEYPMEKTDE